MNYTMYLALIQGNLKILPSILLMFFIIYLFFRIYSKFDISKYKEFEAKIQQKYDELEAVYGELAAMGETLEKQYSELLNNQQKLQESEEKYKFVTEVFNAGIWYWHRGEDKTFFSLKLYAIFDCNKDEVSKIEDLYKFIYDGDLERYHLSVKEYLSKKDSHYECEFRIKTKKGNCKWILEKGKALFDENGEVYRIAGSFTDISGIKEYENEVQHLTYYDALTNLPNRLYLYEDINRKIEACINNGIIGGFLFIDIDNFKFVNDTLNHTMGDKLIVEISKKLSSLTNDNRILLRLGGDELVFYVSDIEEESEIENFAKSIINIFKSPISVEDNVLHITMSIGIAIFPKDGCDVNSLLKSSDIAMYKAKDFGKNGYVFFNNNINNELIDRIQIEKYLRKALKNNEFILYYQPQVDIKNGRISGFEALIRWISPELGIVPPNRFVGVAEETGLIVDLGEWILKDACNFIKRLRREGYKSYTVSVNISIIQLIQNDFVDIVFRVLRESEVSPEDLELEITESILMESFDLMVEKLKILKEKGIKIALDDFGKGYSSLTYLKRLPITTLKIDKSFVDDIENSKISNAIVNSIIMIGHEMDLIIVAEGVETEEQFEYLTRGKCNRIQGYLFSKPLEKERALEILDKNENLQRLLKKMSQ
ncbi:EAL domain-containing protein [Clostridium thailandense]|uniref:bifunctional diguanylate cyclase/phosphodiesterase n=1 Tax=Clostridium thailandense TaxID=2794346 RepID=UPI0039894C32